MKHLKSYVYYNETFKIGEVVHYTHPDLDTNTFGVIEDITEFKWSGETDIKYFIEVKSLYDYNGYMLNNYSNVTLPCEFIQKAEPFIQDIIKELKQNIKIFENLLNTYSSKEVL